MILVFSSKRSFNHLPQSQDVKSSRQKSSGCRKLLSQKGKRPGRFYQDRRDEHLFPHTGNPSIGSMWPLIRATSKSRGQWLINQRLPNLLSWGNELIITIELSWSVCCPDYKGQHKYQNLLCSHKAHHCKGYGGGATERMHLSIPKGLENMIIPPISPGPV